MTNPTLYFFHFVFFIHIIIGDHTWRNLVCIWYVTKVVVCDREPNKSLHGPMSQSWTSDQCGKTVSSFSNGWVHSKLAIRGVLAITHVNYACSKNGPTVEYWVEFTLLVNDSNAVEYRVEFGYSTAWNSLKITYLLDKKSQASATLHLSY